jgi:hypothetical protein
VKTAKIMLILLKTAKIMLILVKTTKTTIHSHVAHFRNRGKRQKTVGMEL